MSNPRLAKLRKQPDSTWALLQKHLISLLDPFQTLFLDEVWSFIQKKADSLSTNAGCVATCLLTTTSFVGGLGATLTNGSQEMSLNLYSIFVGPPTTGKSQALKECATSPMSAVAREQDLSSYIINNCTSLGLIIRPLHRTRRATFCQQRFTTYYSNYLNRTKKTRQEMFRYSVNCFPEKALPFITLRREQGKSLKTQLSVSLVQPKYLSQPASSPYLIKGMVYSTGF